MNSFSALCSMSFEGGGILEYSTLHGAPAWVQRQRHERRRVVPAHPCL